MYRFHRLHEEIEDFFEYIKPTEVEEGVRWHVVKRIEKVVRQMWPQAECAVFGSFYTGIYMPTSDVDLVRMMYSSILLTAIFLIS